MKPGSRDRKYPILITGLELEELQKFTCDMAESFGLDTRIENYQGKRPFGLYRWDLDCLVDVVGMALDDADEYPNKSGKRYAALQHLHERLMQLLTQADSEA